jgi:hypothetical protein
VLLLSAIGVPAAAADGTGSDTIAKVRRPLARLPYYGVYMRCSTWLASRGWSRSAPIRFTSSSNTGAWH